MKNIQKRFLAFALILLFWTAPTFASEQDFLPEWLTISGKINAIHAVQIKKPHKENASRAGLRLNLQADFDKLFFQYSPQMQKNRILSDKTGYDTHELWAEYVSQNWDLRLGRQIIIWGQADGIQITDIISPPDLSEYITQDLDEIRLPVDAVRFRILGSSLTTELIAVPVFRPAVYPSKDSPWALPQMPIKIVPAKEPTSSFENTEIGGKIAGYFSGLDVAASVFHTWDDRPALHATTSPTKLTEKYHRLTIFGLEFSRPQADFVFRGETAFYKKQYLPTTRLGKPLAKNLVKWLLGADWTPGNNWTLTAQIVGTNIFQHEAVLRAPKNSFLATLNISKKYMNERLTLSNLLYFDFEGNGYLDRFKTNYEIADGFHLATGVDIFGGDSGLLAIYQNNSQAYIKATYDF